MIGKKAPSFTGKDQNGHKVSLKDYAGQKVVLYFYPRDSTPTCTTQACNLRDNLNALKKHGMEVIGVSSDSIDSHKKFAEKQQLNFPLLADENLAIHKKYDTWRLKKFMGKEFMGTVRTTFLIDESQKVHAIISKPKSKIHAQEILEMWGLN